LLNFERIAIERAYPLSLRERVGERVVFELAG